MNVIEASDTQRVGGGWLCSIGVLGGAISAAGAGAWAGALGAGLGAFAGGIACAASLAGPGGGAVEDESYRSYVFGA